MKAVIYSRFSTDRQRETSIADQERICTEYAQRERWKVAAKFSDHGISGAAVGNRPGVLKMLEGALAREFDVVLVMDLTRLSRSMADLNKAINRLVSKGVRVIGVQDGYDSARRGHKLQAGLAGIMGEAFIDMIRDRTHAALESRAKTRRPTGGKCYGFRKNVVYEPEAGVVRTVFERFIAGASYRTIAMELNRAAVANPGSHWNRKVRRCRGWMTSAVRSILVNVRYTGLIRWNTTEWRKDPDTGKRLRHERPRSEWHEYRDESLRIVSAATFERAQQRMTVRNDPRFKTGGKAKFRLSGMLRCGVCGSQYTLSNGTGYSCSGYLGGDCHNHLRVRRDRIESGVLTDMNAQMLAPDRAARTVQTMQKLFAAEARKLHERCDNAPAELQAIEARLERLRERLALGDPDMEPDEIEAAIARAETKRRDLSQASKVKGSANVIAMLPSAAEAMRLLREQVEIGLDDDPENAEEARAVLRQLIPDGVTLLPRSDGSLWAEGKYSPGAVLMAVGTDGITPPLPLSTGSIPDTSFHVRSEFSACRRADKQWISCRNARWTRRGWELFLPRPCSRRTRSAANDAKQAVGKCDQARGPDPTCMRPTSAVNRSSPRSATRNGSL